MVDGGDNIREATWESVSSMLQVVSESAGCVFFHEWFQFELIDERNVEKMKRMLYVGLNICVEQREVRTSWLVFTLVKLSLI